MGCVGAVPSTGVAYRPSAQVAAAVNYRGDPLHAARWPAVANIAAARSTGVDGAPLALPVVRQQGVAVIEPCHVADRA